ncbi:hypothetical protein FNF27_00746 [Cafeteria roenbergensis]|uniref:ubiquitinyl hydrolase 1 n=1 Tax=Cafeteria roenbergensis TaxID=33653 RepID=A0A5A8D7L9_CAFRO|nr:hypothetical protein FNF28_07513 [Cafeteria roenbergensis]KAA0160939.1 hypothetical protein FNF31_04011 [Cafeteria roenbergensis]KAA0177576.1 hypothetical protein FNF27_00746 [Cafeteria roenbergensis]
MAITVSVKWGKKKFDDVKVDPAGSSDAFRATLEGLTGVPAAKQKLLCKKGWPGILKAGAPLSATSLSEGAVVTLVGTASKLAAASEKVVFVEDLPRSALASAGAALPPGLANGHNNICYMNATLQCIRAVPELCQAAREAAAGDLPPGAAAGVASALGHLFEEMAHKTEHDDVFPAGFLAAVRAAHPVFAEVAPNGIPRQQDSDEFQNALLGDLATALVKPPAAGPAPLAPPLRGSGRSANVVDSLLGLELDTTMTCDEAPDAEPPVRRTDTQLKLVCNIQGGGGSSTKVNFLSEGLRLAMEGSTEKRSEVLGRDALWTRKSRISRLPPYLCVQFMRFYWQAHTDAAPGAPAGSKFKIKRSVAFPANGLDMFDFCAPDLQKALTAARDKHAREEESRRAARDAAGASADGPAAKRAKEAELPSSSSSSSAAAAAAAAAASSADADDESALEAAVSASAEGSSSGTSSSSSSSPAAPEEGVALPSPYAMPAEFEGIYELFAVVSHAGPDAESGHYTGWVRQGKPGSGSDDWVNFDDETVSSCKTEHVLGLKGSGSDTGDIAYVVFYRAVK